ncbi:MAG TPA: flagellar biosynthesis regulator FlaF [Alphaproteobacteria bacterium]|nr:flagellar biosynthesis regulator FlaF [Alphaproteobacteria bacterium]
MTANNQDKVGAYASNQQQEAELDGRETDKRALLNCAIRLKLALDDAGKDMATYVEAIRHNQRLWTIFQVALCDPENPLPRDLKVTLLNLSRYVDKVSFRAISSFAPNLLNSLIDINRIIANGLGKKTGQAAVQQPPAQPLTPPTSVMTSA